MTPAEEIDKVRRLLQTGEGVPDRTFDRLYPHHVRELSLAFWTPVRVAMRAVELLDPARRRVLDVGSGVGKFCLVAATLTGAEVTGIEHRADLVRIATGAAERLGVRARFVRGELADIDWDAFDAFYFYNPFFENVHEDNHIDETVELSRRRLDAALRHASEALARPRPGTRVVTYHGLGGPMPSTYQLVTSECAGSDKLKLWTQTSDRVSLAG